MLKFRFADSADVNLLFAWTNEKAVRENSYEQKKIEYNEHLNWFNQKLCSGNCTIYIFIDDEDLPVGQVRIEREVENKQAIAGIIVNANNRGKGYSSEMIKQASLDFFKKNLGFTILAYIMKKNISSYKSFMKAGYKLLREDVIKEVPSFILFKNQD